MPEPIIDFSPLDSAGLTENLPSYQAKWKTLTNVIFREGRLRPRPGFREMWAFRDFDLPAVARGVPLAIFEITNPGDVNGNRQGVDYAAETLIPNATTHTVAGWSGAAVSHEAVDDTVPDSTGITSSTAGSAVSFGFSNTANSPEVIPAVVIVVRARTARTAYRSILKFYWGASVSATLLLHTQEVTARESNETDDWQTFAFEITKDLANDVPLTKATVDSMVITMEYAAADSFQTEFLTLAGNGNYQQWKDAADATTAVYTDFDGQDDVVWDPPTTPPFSIHQVDANLVSFNSGIGVATADSSAGTQVRQSWTFSTIQTTFASVTQLNIDIGFLGRTGSVGNYSLFFRTGGTDYVVENFSVSIPSQVSGQETLSFAHALIDSTTNPATSAAWTQAQISGGEFGIQWLSGYPHRVVGVHSWATGTISGASVEVDYISARISEASGDGVGGIMGKTRLWATDKAHLRLTDEGTPDIDDVTNSVALTLPPIAPTDWAVLYGQAYLVNGEDPTRRYPNSSDVYEALTTNNADGATAITGRTVAAFADRILYGWVKDNASFIPEQVAFSQIFNGGTHNHASAGDLDLLDTPGGVLKLKPLSEDICVAYKQQGIYNLRRTGSDVAPLTRDLVDPFTELLAPRTVVSTHAAGGAQVQLFLGTTPTFGINIYMYDGSKVYPIGDGIQKHLRDWSNRDAFQNAFAEADPEAGLVYFFIPEKTPDDNTIEVFPSSGYIYHIRSGSWTRFELPFTVTAAGIWTMSLQLPGSTFHPPTPKLYGTKKVIVGLLGGRLVTLDFDAAYDALWPASSDASFRQRFTDNGSSDAAGENRKYFTCTIESADPRPDAHPGQQVSTYLLHLMQQAHTPVLMTTTASADGGYTEGTAVETAAGAYGDFDRYVHTILSLPQVYAARPRFKLEIDPITDERGFQTNPRWEIAEIWLEQQLQGDNP